MAEEFGDRLLIGEIYLPLEKLVNYYGGADVSGLHLPFNFSLLNTSWNASALAKLITDYEKAVPARGRPNWVLGNHDQSVLPAPSLKDANDLRRCFCSLCVARRPSAMAMKPEWSRR